MRPEELGRLLDDQGAALVLYARQWCQAPEDIVQEAFLRLMVQTITPANPRAWMFRVVRNAAISASRSLRRRRRYESAAALSADAWFVASPDDALDVEAAMEALKKLPIDQRETIVAHLWGGLSFAEVAELTGCSASSAHRNYTAGLQSLRERLGVPCQPKRTTRT